MVLGGLVAVLFAFLIGYACFRFGVIGDYFALVTLALGEIVALTIIAFRDVTGGLPGLHPQVHGQLPSSTSSRRKRSTSTTSLSAF